MPSATQQIDALITQLDKLGTPACVGLDPVFDKLPRSLRIEGEPEAFETFCMGVLDSIAGTIPVVKPQSACFERYGARGYAILERVIARARELDMIVILDAKRGDIGSSATHYAVGAAKMGANFITVSPYMGPSSIEPFLKAGLGVFALARTSNPDSDAIQGRKLDESEDQPSVAHAVSAMIAEMGMPWSGGQGMSALGAVVGATKAGEEVGALRKAMLRQMLLVPGVGAQGGTVADVKPMCRPGARTAGSLGVVINASRSVLYPEGDSASSSWLNAIQRAAVGFADECRTLLP